MKKNISDRLKELMNYYNVTQTDICKRTGIQKSAMSNYLKGIREPRQNVITAICKSFGINEVWLMGYDVQMKKDFPEETEKIKKIANEDFKMLEKFSLLSERDKKIVNDIIDNMIGNKEVN